MPAAPNIEKPKLLVVEGDDEVRIFGALLNHLEVSDTDIRSIRGVDNLRIHLKTLSSLRDFGRVRSLAVVVDADMDRGARRDQIRGALRDAGLPAPPEPLSQTSDDQLKVAYLIVPHESPGTMIEDVCLESVSTDPVIECLDGYFECISQTGVPGPRPHWKTKARTHAFLASRERPDLRLGEAAQNGVWDFDSDAFSPLRDLLKLL